MNLKRILYLFVATLLLLECICRLALSNLFDIPFYQPAAIHYTFYPELKEMADYAYDDTKINILILGGSVVTTEIFEIRMNEEEVVTHFCNLEIGLDKSQYNVISLAVSGHNSMDSRNKYHFLKAYHFDEVLAYHGINDTRTNNVNAAGFDAHYRHIEFYDDLFILIRHPEIRLTVLPFMLDWLVHSIKKQRKIYIPKELFQGLLAGEPEEYLQYGSDIKSKAVFRRNYEDMIDLAGRKDESFILTTYAWYHADGYNYDKFKAKSLDYDQQVYPTELYGIAEHVVLGLEAHNDVVRLLAGQHPHLPFIDFEQQLPKTGQFFNDICHINDEGCQRFAEAIMNLDHR